MVGELQYAGAFGLVSLVRLELWNGARGHQEMALLNRLEATMIDLLMSDKVWALANQLAWKSRQAEKTFSGADLLIAACARVYGAVHIHRDKHFAELKAF